MNEKVQDIIESFKDKAPDMVKDNKGALVGAVIGFLLTDNKQAQSTILGAIAGSIVVDKKEEQ